ncbi:MAG: DUF1761 domain-containing protein [Candidatus Woesearchaeota archaeon]
MNMLIVAVSTVITMLIGALWYMILFREPWMKASGMSEEKMQAMMKKGMWMNYFFALVAAFVLNYIMAYLIDMLKITTVSGGLMLGFVTWLGFSVTTSINAINWEGRPMSLYFINIFQYFVVFLVSSGILSMW